MQLVNYLFLVVIYAVEHVARASAGVPLFWHGTDVFCDPGDKNGGIVPPGTAGDASATIVMPVISN
jgi:hypothetical protein